MTILCFCGSRAGARCTPRVCAAERRAQTNSSQLLALRNSRPGFPRFWNIRLVDYQGEYEQYRFRANEMVRSRNSNGTGRDVKKI